MTRVIHTGDTHIGYQQYNTPERRRDFLRAFQQVAEDAIADDVDAVIHAGDLFHDRRPGLLDLQGTVGVLRTLADADIPFLAVVGNHEGKRDAQWLDLFADLGLATRLEAEPYLLQDVAIYGLDFVPRSRRDALEYEFEAPPDDADHAVLVSHGLFEPFAHADWDTGELLESASVAFDALLLGDNHKPGTAEVADTWVTYCGSTERASASEREDRGYNIVTFEDEPAITRRGLPDTREFVFVDVDLEGEEGIDRVRNRVGEYDCEDAVVIVTLEGEGVPVTPAAVEEYAIERGALVARVNDRREVDEEAVSVSFANPDEAVTDRLHELGLSDAARDIDRAVRDVEDIADANVRETVTRRVREHLETDRAAFQPAAEASNLEDRRTVADAMAERGGGSGSEDTDEVSAADAEADTASEADTDAEADTASEADTDTATESDTDEDTTETDDTQSVAAEATAETGGTDGEVTDKERTENESREPEPEHEKQDDGNATSLGDFA